MRVSMIGKLSASLIGLLAAGVVAVGCAGNGGNDGRPAGEVVRSEETRDTSPAIPPEAQQELVAGNTAFAFDMYQVLAADSDENLFYSPYSISIALAMTYGGARGETERQMAEALHYTLPQEELHPAFNWLDLELESRGEGASGSDGEPFRLRVANATWGQEGFPFLMDYLDLLAVNYGAGMRIMDFVSEPEASREVINEWVSEETEGRIEDLLPEGSIDGSTRLVLTNAIYFNAAWSLPFEESYTRDGSFYRLDGSPVTAEMMSQTEDFRYVEGEGYQAVEMFYDGEELSMIVLLPAEGEYAAFEESLDEARLETILASLEFTHVNLTMPKFTFESGFGLVDAFQELGMVDPFGPADFSGMAEGRDLFISDIFHKAFVAVDEEGTEAAAATAVVVGESSVPPPPVATMTIDRPFLFLIRDRATGAILFLGRVLDPTA